MGSRTAVILSTTVVLSGSTNVSVVLYGLVLLADDLGSSTSYHFVNSDSHADIARVLCICLHHSKCWKESCTGALISKGSFELSVYLLLWKAGDCVLFCVLHPLSAQNL